MRAKTTGEDNTNTYTWFAEEERFLCVCIALPKGEKGFFVVFFNCMHDEHVLNFNVNFNFFAIQAKLEPCNVAEINTTKKTTLKISEAPGKPKIKGNIAKIMGTEPRNPTHETRVISLRLKPEMAKTGITASGLATKINTKAISNPSNHTSNNDVGVINKPNTTNIVI